MTRENNCPFYFHKFQCGRHSASVGVGLMVHPQLCLKICFITRQLEGRQLGKCMSWLKTSERWL